MKHSVQFLVLILMLQFACGGARAQSNYRFHHYDTRDGLASETTGQIIQDSLGFIWIAYYGGISRFDGYEFTVYNYNPDDSLKSPFSSEGLELQLDAAGNLWGLRRLHPSEGIEEVVLIRYDRSLDGFVQYKPDLKSIPLKGYQLLNSLGFEKDDQTIWMATVGSGLYKYNYKTGEIRQYLNPYTDSVTQIFNNWFRGTIIRDSLIMLASRNGIWIFNKNTEKFSRPKCAPEDSTLLYHSNIGRRNFVDKTTNNVWFNLSDYDSLILLTSDYKIATRVSLKHSLLRGGISGVDIDRHGNFWIATPDNGLVKYVTSTNEWIPIKSSREDPYSLRTNWLTTLMIDRDQNIWIGTQEEGLSVLRKQNLSFYNHKIGGFGAATLYTANGIDRIVVSKADTYPQTQESQSELLTAQVIPGKLDEIHWEKINLNSPIKGMVADIKKGKNQLWISSFSYSNLNGGVIGLPIDKTTGKPNHTPSIRIQADPINPDNTFKIGTTRVLGIHEDSNESLWIATEGKGLYKISPLHYGEEGSVTQFLHSRDVGTSINSDLVYRVGGLDSSTLFIDTSRGLDLIQNNRIEPFFHQGVTFDVYRSIEGITYVGTSDGLYILESKSAPYKFRKDPLIKVPVQAIIEDKLGRLWMSNLEGVMCYDPKEKVVLFFDKREGIDHTHGIILKSSNDKLMTANIEGISLFDPLSLIIDRKKTFPVLTSLKVNNLNPVVDGYPGRDDVFKIKSNITVLDELTLDYQHNNFSVQFAAMEMTAPEKNLYRHKLEGYDKDWIETDWRNRSATFTNLPAGTYTFRVKASNHHGVWSDQERTLKVIILPPPWRTNWAYTGYGLLIFGLLYGARKTIVHRERLKSNLKLAQVEKEKEHMELEKVKEVDKIKTSFFTNISHEFRTPLTLIKGPVQNLLEEFAENPKVRERLKLIERNSDLLLKLINQLLDLAKLESGSLKIEKSEGDLTAFIGAVSSSFSSMAHNKNITYSVELPEEHFHALFDKDKLETILINLINNAIKFTPEGGSVTVKAIVEKSNILLSVKDTGIGIPEDQQQAIFERFHQVSEAHKEVGTGIGLALVKELVALLGGTIEVKSKVGEGSMFGIMLPIEIGETVAGYPLPVTGEEVLSSDSEQPETGDRQPATEITLKADGATVKPHILVVEDNTDLRAFIIDSLGNEFHFLEAADGKQGMDKAIENVPDLIVSDVMMPEMDGITMAGKLKSDVRTSHIPIIILTAKSTEESKLSGLQKGADDYLTKPFNKQELLLKVRNGVMSRMKLREKIRLELMKEAPKIEVASADEQFLMKVKEAIHQRLSDEQLSVESVAKEIGLSRAQLYRKVTALTGVSVNELIRSFRLKKAAQLLEQNWGPVSQVAYEVGYSNLSYFSKVFKEEFGVLPSEYSNQEL